MSPLHVEKVDLRQVRMRLVEPFRTSFGVTEERRVLLVKITDQGVSGFGEVTAAEGPFFSHETWETAWHVLSDFIVPWCLGREFSTAAEFPAVVRTIRGHSMAKAGFENALWDLEARQAGRPLWKLLGGVRAEIDCGVSIGIQPSMEALLARIAVEVRAGYQRVKIKIQPGWDLEVVHQVRREFPSLPLMVDANAAYTLDDLPLFQELDGLELAMIEQPLHWADLVDHATLQRALRTPVCLDESIHSADDVRKAVALGACRIVNVKLGRVGGHAAARAVHDAAQARGVPVWCGGMLESGIGRAHNVALSSLENFSLPGDISASRRYWTEDLIEPGVEVDGHGRIAQSEQAGLGYHVREDFIDGLTERRRVFTA